MTSSRSALCLAASSWCAAHARAPARPRALPARPRFHPPTPVSPPAAQVDDQTIEENKIEAGGTIHMVLSLRGGQ